MKFHSIIRKRVQLRTRIFIDFDATLFSTPTFKLDLFEFYRNAGYAEQEVQECYEQECADYKYSIKGNLERLEKMHPYDQEKVNILMSELYKKVPEYLYDDSVEFLRSIDRNKYEVNLLSLGDIEFQSEKINHSGLAGLFDNVLITEQQKWDFLEDKVGEREKFFIIDDRADTAKEIKQKFPASIPIRIVREDINRDDPYFGGGFEGIQIRGLMEAIEYLNKEEKIDKFVPNYAN